MLGQLDSAEEALQTAHDLLAVARECAASRTSTRPGRAEPARCELQRDRAHRSSRYQLAGIEQRFAEHTLVCAYDPAD